MPHSIQSQMREIRCLKEDVGEEELQKQKDEMMLGFSFATMAQLKRAEAWRNVKDRSMGAMFGRLNLVTDWEVSWNFAVVWGDFGFVLLTFFFRSRLREVRRLVESDE